MSLNVGIVGLPNVGKSTLFSALTGNEVEVANYPFCTIEPNTGIALVKDERLEVIAKHIKTEKIIPTYCEFVDIAGLVKGASEGEGLGNKFLSHIRDVGVIAHVVRCFENENVIHVNNKIDPLGDIDTISMELILADLESVLKKKENNKKALKSTDSTTRTKALNLSSILDKAEKCLQDGKPLTSINFEEEEEKILKLELNLITTKKVIYVANVSEKDSRDGNEYSKMVEKRAKEENNSFIKVCGELEREIALIKDANEREELLLSMGIAESALNSFVFMVYSLLGLKTFFTAGEKEIRAWTFKSGMKAPQVAGIIHSDFEKGFIKVEVYNYKLLDEYKSESKIRENGKIRLEGKNYVFQDGDVAFFKFSN